MLDKWTDRVKGRMRAKGYTQEDVAQRISVTKGAVSHYLTGKREPGIQQIKDWARMLDMSLSEFLGDDARFYSDEKQIKAADLIKELPPEKQDIALKLLESLQDQE